MTPLVRTQCQTLSRLNGRSVVLVGTMGAGKSSIGRKLETVLGLPFVDSDAEIRDKCGMSITEYCEKHGEDQFRIGESRVISRLLKTQQIIATGDGAFCHLPTRVAINTAGFSIWLRDDPRLLFARAVGRGDRPFLSKDRTIEEFETLDVERAIFYQMAHFTIDLKNRQRDKVAQEILWALENGREIRALTNVRADGNK